MRRAEFESLLFVDVEERATAEPVPQHGEPQYHGRPWTRLRDEMLATGSETITALPANKIELSYRSTNSLDRSVTRFFRHVFGGN